jgi:lipopolysaccharide transport protein LptA
MKKALLFSLLISIISPCGAAPLGENAFETISISAEEAIEDETPGILHFKGQFLMQSSDWRVTAMLATVYGSLNKPDRIYLEGEPARFRVTSAGDAGKGPIDASALVVEYLRDTDKLKLSGQATLVLGDEVISSDYIEYDITANRYLAGGNDGVSIEVPPID